MEAISIFDIFKIGVGPSSSHTLGPWKAAKEFSSELNGVEVDEVKVHLFGSLSRTGIGHATDKALILGLQGYDSRTIVVKYLPVIVQKVIDSKTLCFNSKPICFNPKKNIVFENIIHEKHPNTLIIKAFLKGVLVKEQLYMSIGGGFLEKGNEEKTDEAILKLPCPIVNAVDIVDYIKNKSCTIADLVFENEQAFRSKEQIEKEIDFLLETMLASVYRGCTTDGVLPGGLNVKRRAKSLCEELLSHNNYTTRDEWIETIKKTPKDFGTINKWISCFALAVNEENAAMGRIVTSPTNGAAGVIPAVMFYYYLFCDYKGKDSLREFLFTAGEVGCLFKKGATISAAVGGCQAEIGVSSAMAAAGLTAVLGGSPARCLMAAEIAMEHHLGLTCDPVGGLVQVPCIERNAMGAIKAITASNLALTGNPENAIVKLDTVIRTMWNTAQDMNYKYKETSEGGLAYNIPVILPSC